MPLWFFLVWKLLYDEQDCQVVIAGKEGSCPITFEVQDRGGEVKGMRSAFQARRHTLVPVKVIMYLEKVKDMGQYFPRLVPSPLRDRAFILKKELYGK